MTMPMPDNRKTIAYLRLNRQQKALYIAQVEHSAKTHRASMCQGAYDEYTRGCHKRNMDDDLATLRLLLSETLYNDFLRELETFQ